MDLIPLEQAEFPSLEQLVEQIKSRGPGDGLLRRGSQQFETAFAQVGVDHEPAEWDRLWSRVEAEMKDRDQADDLAEGRR